MHADYKSDAIDLPATIRSEAMTALGVRVQSVFVIDRDLLARRNVAEREKQYVAMDGARESVRGATVVDVVRAVAAPAAIETPSIVDIANPQLAAATAPLGFRAADSLTRVLGNFSATTKRNRREASFAVNR